MAPPGPADRFLGLDDRQADPQTARIVLLPVPFERTSSYGRGAARGPASILRASREVELFDTELGVEPWKVAGGIHTLEPLAIDEDDDGPAVMQKVEQVARTWGERGRLVVTLAGEHTGVVGAIRAHVMPPDDELTVLQLDAHSDLRTEYLGDPWNHACAMARVLDFHDHLVQVGIRSESREDRALAAERDVTVWRAADIHDDDRRDRDWIAPILDACRPRVYVTFDCDVLDPSIMPATGTPEPGGLTWRQVNTLLARLCRTRQVVGFDVSELAPLPGLHHPQFTVAKLMARFMSWIGAADDRATAADRERRAPALARRTADPEAPP